MSDLGGRAPFPELGAEVDPELPGRVARLGKVLDARHPPDAHVDAKELLEGGHVAAGRLSWWAAGWASGSWVRGRRRLAQVAAGRGSPGPAPGAATPAATGPANSPASAAA